MSKPLHIIDDTRFHHTELWLEHGVGGCADSYLITQDKTDMEATVVLLSPDDQIRLYKDLQKNIKKFEERV